MKRDRSNGSKHRSHAIAIKRYLDRVGFCYSAASWLFDGRTVDVMGYDEVNWDRAGRISFRYVQMKNSNDVTAWSRWKSLSQDAMDLGQDPALLRGERPIPRVLNQGRYRYRSCHYDISTIAWSGSVIGDMILEFRDRG